MVPSIFTRKTTKVFIPLLIIFATKLSFENLCRSPEVFFSYFFFHLHFFDGVHFQYSQVLVIFLLSKCSNAFLIWLFYSFHCLTFPIFHYEYGTFSYVKFHSYILAVYSYCLYQGLHFFFFFIFCKYLYIIHVHKVINFFLQFSKIVVPPRTFLIYVVEWHHCYNE